MIKNGDCKSQLRKLLKACLIYSIHFFCYLKLELFKDLEKEAKHHL